MPAPRQRSRSAGMALAVSPTIGVRRLDAHQLIDRLVFGDVDRYEPNPADPAGAVL